MEWLALGMWALVALVAVPVGTGMLVAPLLGLVPLLGLAGLVLSVVFAATGGATLAWIAFGLGLTGAAVIGAGARELIADDPFEEPNLGPPEETASAFAGIAWPLYLVAAACSLMAALAADGTL